MSYRGELFLTSFTSSNYLLSVFQWNRLLQFYVDNQTTLDESDLFRIYDLSEQCRRSLNKPKAVVKDGLTHYKAGLDIKKDEVFSDLYKRVETIKEQQELRARSFTPLSLPSEHNYHLAVG